MKTAKEKQDAAAHVQLARDRACLYLRNGFTVAETAQEIGKSRAFVYDSKARGSRDAVPVPVVPGDPVLPLDTLQGLIDAPYDGLDTPEQLARECLRLYALAEPKAAEGDRNAAFVVESMIDNLAHLDTFGARKGKAK